MKPILHKIFPRLVGTTALTVTTLMLGSGEAFSAEVEITQQVINGLHYPTNSQRFFEQGRRTFEQEIQLMLQRLQSSPETLLHIREDLPAQIREEWLLQEELRIQENPQIVPDLNGNR
ncbi:MAG: hypothetical protein F6J92_17885 [Symploca sp. SIO1A3]|nr:hypothetical protein [Symploca sp. SIO1A3]